MIETISVVVSIIFGVLTIITVYPKGRKWLADTVKSFFTKVQNSINTVSTTSGWISKTVRRTIESPVFYFLISALILCLLGYLIIVVDTPIAILRFVLSSSTVDGVIVMGLSLVLLAIIFVGFQKAKLIPSSYQLIKKDEYNEISKRAERYNTLSSLVSEKEEKIKSLEIEIIELQSTRKQKVVNKESNLNKTETNTLSNVHETLSDFLQSIPDEIKQQPAKLNLSSVALPLSDKQARVDLRTDFGSGDHEFTELLNIIGNLGSDVKIYGRLDTLVLVRDQVFAIFQKGVTDDKFNILSANYKPTPIEAYLYIHKRKLFDKIKKQDGVKAYMDMDSKLPLNIRNIWELEDDEIEEIILEAYQNA